MKRKKIGLVNVWPGFVDAISTLLLVFVFLLAVLMISENFLTQALSGKNTALDNLRLKLKSLELEVDQTSKENSNLSSLLDTLNNQLEKFKLEKNDLEKSLSNEELKSKNLNLDIDGLQKKLSVIVNELGLEKLKVDKQDSVNETLTANIKDLNNSISNLNKKLQTIQSALDNSNEEIISKDNEITDLGNKLNLALSQKVGELEEYRSEFFGRLKKIIGEEEEINIVGDRFVLQSEVFFQSGSAKIGLDGEKKVKEITNILTTITKKIPVNIDWLIQVEGHTDNLPISTKEYPSNWELSTARAIAVAKIMMNNGIASDRINVAGYGEFKPIVKNNNQINREKNRRIELKLTQP